MGRKKRKTNRIVKYLFKPSVGKLLVLLMAAYFIFTFSSIVTRTEVNYYEVEEGNLVKERTYTGLIVREEEIYNAEASGYIYYFVANGRKAAAGQPVYSIDETGDLAEYLKTYSSDEDDSSSPVITEIRNELLNVSRSFSQSSFSSLYDLYDTISSKAAEYSSLSIFSSMADELNALGIRYQQFYTGKSGTVCYYTDNMEDIDIYALNAELFDVSNYVRNTIKAGDLVQAGDPAYKLITNETWYIAFQMDSSDEDSFADSSSLKVNFPEQGFSASLPFEIVYGTDGGTYGVFTLSSYLVQFASDRYIEFEIVTNDVSGLKIPDSSITTKDFYVIPTEYLSTDNFGNEGFYKVLVSETGYASEFIITDIYSSDEDYCYIECTDTSELQPGDFVMLPKDASITDSADALANLSVSSSLSTSQNSITDESLTASDGTDTDDEDTASDDAEDNADTKGDDEEDNNTSADNDLQSNAEDEDIINDEDILSEDPERASGSSERSSVRNNSGSLTNNDEDPLSSRNSSQDAFTESLDEDNENSSNNTEDNISNSSSSAEDDPDSNEDDLSEADTEDSSSGTASTSSSEYVNTVSGTSGGLYQINVMMPLTGVYNINKGYTVFRKVEILESANGYSIVRKNTRYGLSTYDHIVLDASLVEDDQIIYR